MLPTRTHSDSGATFTTALPVLCTCQAIAQPSPSLQAMDRALFGGSPEEQPERYERGNPITYVDDVRAPVLFVVGDHDSRCPPAQAYAYVDRLAAREAPHQLYRFETGHGSHVTDEDVRQQRVIIDFLRANVPGPVLVLLSGLFGRRYRKEVATVWRP